MGNAEQARKLRILHVAEPSIAGVPRYIQMLLKYANHEKFENILVGSQAYRDEDWNGLADELERVDMRHEISKADFTAIHEVRKLIKKYQPDIVYAHSSKAGAIVRVANIGMKNADGERVKCIYNPHGWAFNMECGRKKQMLYTVIEKIAAPFCDKIICISEAEKESALERRICKEDKLQVILNGVDIDGYEQREIAGLNEVTRESLGIPSDAFIVGMVGRITKQKAPDVFIKAARLIKEKIPEAYFIIVGDGTYQKWVEEYAAKHSLADSLLITGWVENASDYIDLFDVALLLSRWEGFGLAIPEYMLAGKPVVATRVDAIPSIIEDGKNGLLVDAEDAARACNAVMRLYEDSELRLQMINRGRITVHEKYDAKRVSRESEEIIDELLKDR